MKRASGGKAVLGRLLLNYSVRHAEGGCFREMKRVWREGVLENAHFGYLHVGAEAFAGGWRTYPQISDGEEEEGCG